MNHINIQYYNSKIGELILGSFEHKLCLLDFKNRKNRASIDNRIKTALKSKYIERDCEILKQTKKQICSYLMGTIKTFDIPLLIIGTEFQKNVWNELTKIPYGETSTYLQTAKNIGNEKAVRAVANAIGANPLNIIIPCHRIIGKNGALVGYSGRIPAKKHLLGLEHTLS
ncbi:MAG: methylated-DNA--[protein]-cysteine S-methyltransferase [Deltaproteobacteria bacterium]|nr:methylated-DNA--[protein]-cysteine S-methyltransferase [Deltaproteobacteria bacterium]